MVLHYSKVTGEHYLDRSDEYEEETEEFDYEIDYEQFLEALSSVYFDKKFGTYHDYDKDKRAKGAICDLFRTMFENAPDLENDYAEDYRDEITEYWEHEAMESEK